METLYIFKKDYFGFTDRGGIANIMAKTMLKLYGTGEVLIHPAGKYPLPLPYFCHRDNIQPFVDAGIIAKAKVSYRLKIRCPQRCHRQWFFFDAGYPLKVIRKELYLRVQGEIDLFFCSFSSIQLLIDENIIEEYYEEDTDENN